MTRGLLSLACWMVLIIWTSKLSLAEELSSQAEAPEQLTNNELRELLKILDEPGSKEVPHFDSHPLLHLGELLLDDDDDSPKDETVTSTTTTTTTTPRPTTTTTPQPPMSTPTIQISRRDDTEPSNEQLVQQLSLFNSLLMSLSAENATTPAPDGPPPLTAQQVALLQSLFGNLTTPQTTETSLFLKRQTESPKTPSPSSPEIAALTELLTQIAKAPADANGNLNLQSIVGGGVGNNEHLKNFHNSNANMDPAASNQLSGLLTLLGTLGSLSQTQQQLQSTGSLFNFGAPTVASPISNNFLAGLLQPQAQPSQQNPNVFGNLFNQHQPQAHEQQPFNFGGLGSVISTMSNILGGSGAGGKPRVRGVDTRLGLGYRFGDAADAQIMWDIGPQLFTDPLQNEAPRYPMTKQKRQDSAPHPPTPPGQQIQAAAKVEKEQQQLAASRRYFQLHQQGQYHNPTRRNFFINPPTTTRKPYNHVSNLTPYAQEQALKELWQLMEMKKQLDRTKQTSSYSQNALGMLTPADLYQMQRNKHIIKRASTPQSNLNKDPTLPTVFKREAEPHTAESFLRFRKIAPNTHSSFSKKSTGGLHRNHPPSPQPLQTSPSSGGIFNLNNIFGMFMSPPSKQKLRPPNRNNFNNSRPPPQESSSLSGGGMSGSPSQMSRWDMEDHRFDNFKNTNGELVMTDTNANDRFKLRNINRNGGFLGS
ncbi:uncharacterized protein LOC110843783 isoform X2 [Folsomia candida]|uniref:Uncharacterized protein n=1 Tax=Folsomia candida TaxID=158441 RepID=A0A226ER27_FOLCA|nr:uncharacterized protein LOC110843783 isoform X2 [Folsomia candida]OXA60085.1 hypothetical protein Fcan01_05333 [Folsomia candida]